MAHMGKGELVRLFEQEVCSFCAYVQDEEPGHTGPLQEYGCPLLFAHINLCNDGNQDAADALIPWDWPGRPQGDQCKGFVWGSSRKLGACRRDAMREAGYVV